jgi:hypothetical protein
MVTVALGASGSTYFPLLHTRALGFFLGGVVLLVALWVTGNKLAYCDTTCYRMLYEYGRGYIGAYTKL